MSVARWSLRLPRAVASATEGHRGAGLIEHQRRWISKPPPRTRPWASRSPQQQSDASHQQSSPHNDDGGSRNPASSTTSQRAQGEQQAVERAQPGPNTQLATTLAESDTSDLVSEVHMPDDPNGVLPPDHPAVALLGNSSLVIQRQIEMMNIIVGFEQANRYIIMDGQGATIGYIAEQDHGIGSSLARNVFTTHRSFTTHIFDREEREVLRIHRPFAFINSRIRIYDPVPDGGYTETATSTALQGTSASSAIDQGSVAQVSPLKLDEMRIIGEAQQQWAPLRRKYNLFTYRPLEKGSPLDDTPRIESGQKPTSDTMALTESKVPEQAIEAGMLQFSHVDEPFLSWDFNVRNQQDTPIGSVNRNFGGFAREIFTDTGVYVLRMDSASGTTSGGESVSMTQDQRAVMLATAVSIDFDYFSRHSGHSGFMPMWLPFGGGGGGVAAEGAGAAGAGAAGAGAAGAGAIEGAGAGAVGAAGRGIAGSAASEGAIAGAGTMAGYEAMQRGVYGSEQQQHIPPEERIDDGASPQSQEPFFDPDNQGVPGQQQPPQQDDSFWNSGEDPWGRGGGGGPTPPSAGGDAGGGGGGEGGGGWLDSISDFFGD